ncbi:DUF4913 domain-containing protein [Streptomyces bathyalis]|uniref:DUF4913 domain-containing protein n=1 Tax=Streptomyces bathyalis TaxID=2710756 RepID=A0A7T1TCB1_9ACTN|nr:DUF4913 domain-containing protein [Streptomyces bathyalis]QPP10305.1 DUF4913 domain-containing protein [Streptomyces bathyalis]
MDPVRVPESGLEDLEATVRGLMEQSAQQAHVLDHVATPPSASPRSSPAAFPMPGMPELPAAPPEPRPILELEGEAFENELDALTDWVDDFLMDTYGTEVSTAAPWCMRWQEHDDVVAWLHALWMAYQQHKEPDAGLSGMAVWHRDFLTHTIAAVRGPGGPLSACMTDPDRPSHRMLPGPKRSTRSTRSTHSDAHEPEQGEAAA